MSNHGKHFEYKIKGGDTFSNIIFKMFGYGMNDNRYNDKKDYLLTINPHITNPDLIKAGDILHLDILPLVPKPSNQTVSIPLSSTMKPPKVKTAHKIANIKTNFITTQVNAQDMDNFWALSWLAQNSNYLTIPGGIAMSANENLLSAGNVGLINNVSDHYADYKSGRISKGQYDYRRKISLDKLKNNIGPFEKWIFGKNTTHESIRIARSGAIPATANITMNANKLNKLASLGKAGGIALVGVGLTASCMQIAKTKKSHEKNEIFVETIASTSVGIGAGAVIGLFLVSNPIGWGTAVVLAVGSAALSYGSGKLARYTYDSTGSQIDFVSGSGIGRICK